MHFTQVLLLASTASAFSFPNPSILTSLFARKDGGGSGSCPAVWNKVSKALTQDFLKAGQCSPLARAAIREIFHDCGAWNTAQGATGGCDGSLILSASENARNENRGLQEISAYLKNISTTFNVGVADTIVFAGSHAVVTCPGGPQIKTLIGRKDSSTPAPDGLLPDVNAPAADLWNLFKAKGFDERDLAALLGAHSTSNQFNFDTAHSGAGQDSTPGVWDVKYYAETNNPPQGVVVLPSDAKLSKYDKVGKEFQGFVGNQGKWTGKFSDAMEKMALFGSKGTSGMVDCTDALPKSTNLKREMRALPLFAPRH